MNYDAAGNLLSYLTANYTYDQENRLLSTAGMTYAYDGNGERVLKSQVINNVLTPVKRYWSVGGNTLAEGDGSGNLTAEYIYFGGKRLARIDLPANTVHYYLSDHLGSTSIVASATGTVEEESDYYPFGTEVVVTGGVNELKFTGKRRDTESQLDYFGARHFGSPFGRFMTPDDFAKDSDVRDPMSWNKYAYARDNPLRYIDPTGEKATVTSQCDKDKKSCQVSVTATIAIYSVNGTTGQQLKEAQSAITSQVSSAWSGSFSQNGTTYNVTTSVTVTIVDSEKAGIKSGAQNVLGIDASGKTALSHIDANGTGRSYDKGVFDLTQVKGGGVVPHEFSHILGLDDNHGDVLSNAHSNVGLSSHPHATAQDLQWAFGPELKAGKTSFTVGQWEGLTLATGNNRGDRKWWEGYVGR